jgi:hypothetical protein
MSDRYLMVFIDTTPNLQDYGDGTKHPKLKNLLVRLGRPLKERQGVPNRRALWAHPFPTSIPDGDQVMEFDHDGDGGTPPVAITVKVTSSFPGTWRYPVQP